VKASVFDGAYHEVDSSEMAFKICSSICFKEACKRAKPVLLEPVARYGGRYLVRGGALEILEGDWPAGRLVVVEFPTTEQAKKWYHSSEYAEALEVSRAALKRRMILAEGRA
jgi:uncharacterized protein (DUF1330 family)